MNKKISPCSRAGTAKKCTAEKACARAKLLSLLFFSGSYCFLVVVVLHKDILGYVHTLLPVAFCANTKNYQEEEYEHLSDMWLSTLEISAVQLRSVTEIAPESPFLCVNRIPIRYGFRTGGNAIRYGVNIAFNIGRRYLKLVQENKTVKAVV